MKKPNITQGEWGLKEITNPTDPSAYDHSHFIHSEVNDDIVCDIISDEFNTQSIENAKAISAVPEMIDALIEYTNAKAGPTEAYQKAIKALKKAGCTE